MARNPSHTHTHTHTHTHSHLLLTQLLINGTYRSNLEFYGGACRLHTEIIEHPAFLNFEFRSSRAWERARIFENAAFVCVFLLTAGQEGLFLLWNSMSLWHMLLFVPFLNVGTSVFLVAGHPRTPGEHARCWWNSTPPHLSELTETCEQHAVLWVRRAVGSWDPETSVCYPQQEHLQAARMAGLWTPGAHPSGSIP